MSTNTQNAANAQFSTGPRTEAGKAISSRNALKHGLTAKTVLLPGEDPAEYQILRDGMFHDFDPFNTTEAALVSDLEARILAADSPDFKALGKHRERQLEEAERVYQADQILNRPSTLAEVGFDFSIDDFEAQLTRQAALKAADQTIAEYKYPFPEEENDDEEFLDAA